MEVALATQEAGEAGQHAVFVLEREDNRIVRHLAAMGEHPDARQPVHQHDADDPEKLRARIELDDFRRADVKRHDQDREETGRDAEGPDHLPVRGVVAAARDLVRGGALIIRGAKIVGDDRRLRSDFGIALHQGEAKEEKGRKQES